MKKRIFTMKRIEKGTIYYFAGLIMLVSLTIFLPNQALGATLFFEDFESDLSNWSSNTYGVIVSDPLESDNALSFTGLNAAGDIFYQTINNPTGNYVLSFDYLGTCGNSDCGGYIGYNPGDVWLAGTGSWPKSYDLPDTGEWEQVTFSFSGPTNISIKIEDWFGSGGVAGDVFFDNVLLTDQDGPTPTNPVPEPSTVLLLGSGIFGLVVYRKRLQMDG